MALRCPFENSLAAHAPVPHANQTRRRATWSTPSAHRTHTTGARRVVAPGASKRGRHGGPRSLRPRRHCQKLGCAVHFRQIQTAGDGLAKVQTSQDACSAGEDEEEERPRAPRLFLGSPTGRGRVFHSTGERRGRTTGVGRAPLQQVHGVVASVLICRALR